MNKNIKALLNGKEYQFVEVPEDSYDFKASNFCDNNGALEDEEVPWFCNVEGKKKDEKYYPDSNTVAHLMCPTISKGRHLNSPYTIKVIGLSENLTEEQWKGIIESAKTFGYKKYDAVDGELHWVSNATKSGLSLIKSLGLKPKTTLMLLKEIK